MKTKIKKPVKETIIEVALELFYEKGYLATGINEIISKAGISKGTFYHYFPSKEDLCIAYLQERHLRWSSWFKENINSTKDPKVRYSLPFDLLINWMKTCNYRGCAFLNIAAEVVELDSKIRKEVIYHKDSLKSIFREIIRDLKKAKPHFKKIEVEKVTNGYFVLFEGAIIVSRNYGEIWPIEAAKESALKLLD